MSPNYVGDVNASLRLPLEVKDGPENATALKVGRGTKTWLIGAAAPP